MIRGKTRSLTCDPLKTDCSASIHNRFDIEVIDSITGKIKTKAKAENIILNQLWNRMFSPATWFNYIHYGSGTTTPAITDTSLSTFIGYGTPSTANDIFAFDIDTGVASFRRKIILTEIMAVGAVLSEVGIAYGTASTTLVTHAILQDMNGNPISIEKTNTDIINIYATVFVNWDPNGYVDGKVLFAFSANSKPATTNDNLASWIFGLYVPNLPNFYYLIGSGTWLATVTPTRTYDLLNKKLTVTVARLGASAGNIAGGLHSAYLMGEVLYFRLGGNALTNEAIATGDGSTKNFKTKFGLITNPTIYVNAVAQGSGIVIDTNKPYDTTNVGKYFILTSENGTPYMGTGELAGSNRLVNNHTSYFYNPYYEYGVVSFTKSAEVNVYVSNDHVTWTQITSPVNSEYRKYKYWKVVNTSPSEIKACYNLVADTDTYDIHFDTAPASGAVITGDYTTAALPKDKNHVFDLTFSITFGEKTT